MAALLKSEAFTTRTPLIWIALGWRDIWAHPAVSFGFGAMVLLIGGAICISLWAATLSELIPAAVVGFALVAPILAGGLHEVSRKTESGERIRIYDLFGRSWLREGAFIVGLFLVFAMLAWMRIAVLLGELFFPGVDLSLGEFVFYVLQSDDGPSYLAIGTSIGAVLATAIFAVSAFSIPMLVDRNVDALTAMYESVKVVLARPLPSLLWALWIALFIAASIATGLVGLIVTFPLLGYATWHAYRHLATR